MLSDHSSYYGTLVVAVVADNFSFILEQQFHTGSQSVVAVAKCFVQVGIKAGGIAKSCRGKEAIQPMETHCKGSQKRI